MASKKDVSVRDLEAGTFCYPPLLSSANNKSSHDNLLTIADMTEYLKIQLRLPFNGSTITTIDTACFELGVNMDGGLIHRAARCCEVLNGRNSFFPKTPPKEAYELVANTWYGYDFKESLRSNKQNNWKFCEDKTFCVALFDQRLNGSWNLQSNVNAPGGLVLRLEWYFETIKQWAEFYYQVPGSENAYRCVDSSADFIRSWSLRKADNTSLATFTDAQPVLVIDAVSVVVPDEQADSNCNLLGKSCITVHPSKH